MFKESNQSQINEGFTSSDILAILAIVVSLFSLIFTYYSTFLAKQVEIKIIQFNKICLEPVENFLNSINSELSKCDTLTTESKNLIVNEITGLNSYLISLSKVYPNIKTITYDTFTDTFSDCIFDENINIQGIKIEFFGLKQSLIFSLLEFAIYQELSIFKKLWFSLVYNPLKNITPFTEIF